MRPLTPRKVFWICAGLFGILFVVVVMALRMGAYPISVRDIVMTLFNGAIGRREQIPSEFWLVVFGLRLPRIALGILGSDFLVDLELDAAQKENRGTVISSPKVITANQREAVIRQGVEIPYQQSASSGATTIAFKDAVLELKVKPLITPDGRVILDLTVSDDTVGSVVVASGGVNVPAINTRAIETQVVLTDGQTVVLGGILETNHTDAETKVPWLGDIPVLGNLFKNTTKTDDKDELLVFVTPKIIHEGISVN